MACRMVSKVVSRVSLSWVKSVSLLASSSITSGRISPPPATSPAVDDGVKGVVAADPDPRIIRLSEKVKMRAGDKYYYINYRIKIEPTAPASFRRMVCSGGTPPPDSSDEDAAAIDFSHGETNEEEDEDRSIPFDTHNFMIWLSLDALYDMRFFPTSSSSR